MRVDSFRIVTLVFPCLCPFHIGSFITVIISYKNLKFSQFKGYYYCFLKKWWLLPERGIVTWLQNCEYRERRRVQLTLTQQLTPRSHLHAPFIHINLYAFFHIQGPIKNDFCVFLKMRFSLLIVAVYENSPIFVCVFFS